MLYEITVPQFLKILNQLNVFLDRAASFADTKKLEPDVLLNCRLAPDQFNFTKQIQATCDVAKLCIARLSGKTAPVNEDTEKTIAELKNRITQTVDFIQKAEAKDFSGAEEKKMTHPRWEGKYLLGKDFVLEHALPNFYFHTVTAYSILRHNGVDLGKKDFLGPLPFKT